MINDDPAVEIDFHRVGEGEKSGDAISIQYGLLNSKLSYRRKVIVIDGGTIDNGERMVEHINKYYHTKEIDLMISTHPDNDHSSGLRILMDKLIVKELWMHTPWKYPDKIIDLFADKRLTPSSLADRLIEDMSTVSELECKAAEKGIRIINPFEGREFDNDTLKVLGPSCRYYRTLIKDFRQTPTPISEGIFKKAVGKIAEAVTWAVESMDIETLDESGETSAENNSSVVSLFNYSGIKILFTADAGIPALNNVIEYAKNNNISLSGIEYLQVPHHGSKRNISPNILNNIMPKKAIVSCSADGAPKHPAKKVTNALIRRRTKVYTTSGNSLFCHCNRDSRPGYIPSKSVEFYDRVEE